jgi:hypothetical protein
MNPYIPESMIAARAAEWQHAAAAGRLAAEARRARRADRRGRRQRFAGPPALESIPAPDRALTR